MPKSSTPITGPRSSNAWLARTCAVLGIRLVHCQPYSPEGRGKQERLNRYIRDAFLSEATHQGIDSSTPSTTCSWPGPSRWPTAESTPRPTEPPIERFEARRTRTGRPIPSGCERPSAGRSPAKSPAPPPCPSKATSYAVDPSLVGRRVELRYDPEDLTRIDVYTKASRPGWPPRSSSAAIPTGPCPKRPAPGPEPTGVDYLGMVAAAHDEEAGTGMKIDFAQLAIFDGYTEDDQRGGQVSAAPWVTHFGLERTPFGKSIAAKDLFVRPAHAEAVARINFCVVESALGRDHR